MIGICAAVIVAWTAAYGQYGEKALRPNLSPEAYFRTEDGREKKRNADALINRYRLYDFYRRQADFYMAQGASVAALLPPYPGLDGGRRGHWGATNEKETTGLPRKNAPAFSTVTSRNGDGELFIKVGASGVLVFSVKQPGLRSAFPSTKMSVPEHPFGTSVDRFGGPLVLSGAPVWKGVETEWSEKGKPAAWFGGYHVNGSDAAILWEIAGARVLELPSLVGESEGFSALARKFEFLSATDAELSFSFPVLAGAKVGDGPAATVARRENGSALVRYESAGKVVLHSVAVDGKVDWEPHSTALRLRGVNAGARIQILSWVGSGADEENAASRLDEKSRSLVKASASPIPAGGPSQLGPEIRVAGILNADPEASGTEYEIDDIPLPGDAPPFAPMTLCGLDFAADGTAYACTLVGDVWKISGLSGDLRDVRWKRFAAGLNTPMGVQVVDGVPYVMTVPNIIRLTDVNGDGEADFYERFSRQHISGSGQNGRDLRRDADGNFYTNNGAGIWRISRDGSRVEKVGDGSRNPLGLAVRADGLAISDSSEGESENGTCTLFESMHPENAASVAKRKRILYLPRGIDNSPGSRLFLNEPRFGPLGNSLIGVSFGTGTWYSLIRDVVDGTPQAALLVQPGLFLSGSCRLAVQPLDRQVFVAGLDGWGDYAIAEGCLHRLRYTGGKSARVTGWRAHRNGIRLEFSAPLAAGSVKRENVFVQQWNYVDSARTYGSVEMSVRSPESPGHDRLSVEKVSLSADGKSVFVELPAVLPAMCSQVRAVFADANGRRVDVDLYATLQKLAPEPPGTPASVANKPVVLVPPTKEVNGDTYQTMVEHFDRLAGRVPIARGVTPEVKWNAAELNYEWIKTNLLTPSCLACHGIGTQHDYTAYAGVKAKVRLDAPEKSAILGMMQSGSMPPYPLPTISPSMQKAVLEWIRRGAPE
jgi:hypothetical protein